MPLELLPALLIGVVLATVVIGVARALRGRAAPGAGVADVVDASIGMWLVRRLRAGRGRGPDTEDAAAGIVQPAAHEVAYRIGAVGAVRPTPPTRLVAVGSTTQPRPLPRPVVRPATPEPPDRPIDPRLRLWRDTTVVALAIGFVMILGTQFQPLGTRGGVLAATFEPELPAGATLPPVGGEASPATPGSPVPSADPVPPEPTRASEPAGTGGSKATPRPAVTRTPSPTVRPTDPPPSPPTPAPSASASPSPTPTDSPTESPTPPTPTPPTPTPTPEPTATPTEELTPPP